ncbi:MAG: hypothetical protein EHM78_02145 [Myxococcaceae bacterium]|nr:MAG: hypothetical protein EHM78_02145 [Myxococcaceae bacterium]
MPIVTLLNFGDGPRVFVNVRGRPRQAPVGSPVNVELTQRTIDRIKKHHKNIVIVPEGTDIDKDSPQLIAVLDTLRNYDQLEYNEILTVVNRVIGEGVMGSRPNHGEMRLELARRAANAAHHIQAGAVDEANAVLMAPIPKKEDPAEVLKREKIGLVIGDDEDEDSENEELSDANSGTDGDEDTEEADGGSGEGQGGSEEAGHEGPGRPATGQGGGRDRDGGQEGEGSGGERPKVVQLGQGPGPGKSEAPVRSPPRGLSQPRQQVSRNKGR